MGDPIDSWINEILNEGQTSPPAGGGPQPPNQGGRPPATTNPPPGVPEWLWARYQAAEREYDEVWNDLKQAGAFPDAALTTRANNAKSMVTSILAQMDNYMPKGGKEDTWSTGSTSSPFLTRQKPDGTMEQMPNPNYVPPRGPQAPQLAPRYPEEERYANLRNQELEQKLSGELTPAELEQRDYSRKWAENKLTHDKTQDEARNQQEAIRAEIQRREAATKAWAEMLNTRIKASNTALIPGQQYFLGYQPGGAAENIAKMWGEKYNPEVYRVPAIQYDEGDAWRAAWANMGGK